MIRGKKVMVSAQADYDQYHQQHAAQYEAYVAGDAKGAELGPDMEVAEGVTKAIGDPELLEAMGLGERPSPEAITALGAGRHGVTGEQLVAPRAGYDRVAYNDLVYSAPKSVSVEFAAARAAGDYVRAAQLVEDIEASVRVGLDTFCQLLPVARRGLHSSLPMHAQLAALTNVHSAARPVKGQAVPDPHLHVHTRILNVALGADGKWSAVDYRALYHNVRVLNGLVEAEMQHRLQARGYATVAVTHSEKRENDPLRTERQPWRSFELARVPGGGAHWHVRPKPGGDPARRGAVARAGGRRREGPRPLAHRGGAPSAPADPEGGPSREPGVARAEDAGQTGQSWTTAGAPSWPVTGTPPRSPAAPWRPRRRPRGSRTSGAWPWRLWASVAIRTTRCTRRSSPMACGERASPAWRAVSSTRGRHGGCWSPGRSARRASPWTTRCGPGTRPSTVSCPHAVAASLEPAAVVDVLRRVEAGAVMLDPGAAQGGGDPRSDAVFSTHDLIETERRVATYIAELHDEATINVPEQAIQGALSAEARAARRRPRPRSGAGAGAAGAVQPGGLGGHRRHRRLRQDDDAAPRGRRDAGRRLSGPRGGPGRRRRGGAPGGDGGTQLEHRRLPGAVRVGQPVGTRRAAAESWPEHHPSHRRGRHGRLTDLRRLIDVAERSGVAALRTVGDPKQTQPVGAGGIFAHLARQLPTAVLSTNYRQGQHQGAAEASASALLRDGEAGKYLMVKDHAGLLQVDDTLDLSAARAVEDWAGAIAAGGSPREHVLLSDLNDVADNLNAQARAAMEQMGRLGTARVQCGQLEYAAGDRVSFVAKHVASRPRVDREGHPLLRKDGTLRTGRVVTPKRTRGEVVGVDPDAGGITVRTDGQGRLPSRLVTLTAAEAGNVLGRGYAMTTTTAQARGWDATYGVLCASRVSGLEQAYTMQTRARTETRVYANSESVHAEPDASRDLRTATIDAYAEALGRVTEKCHHPRLRHARGEGAAGGADDPPCAPHPPARRAADRSPAVLHRPARAGAARERRPGWWPVA